MAFAGRRPCMPEDGAGPARVRESEHLSKLYNRLAAAIRLRWRGADMEDVVQDAFLRLSMAEKRIEVLDRPAFLYVTAFNLVRDRIRADATRGALLVDTDRLERIISDCPSTERILAAREQLAIVDAAIAELPLNARAAFVMYRLDNMPHAKIAEELSVSVSMVEKHVRRALSHCRGRLAEAEDDGVLQSPQRG